MRGPDFIGIGQQKAGTGWLYDQLDSHPDFWLPPVKELHFFDRGLNFNRLEKKLNRLLVKHRPDAQLWRISEETKNASNVPILGRPQIDLEFHRDLEFYRLLMLTPEARALERVRTRHHSVNGGADFADSMLNKHLQFYSELFGVTDQICGDITPSYSVLSPSTIRLITSNFPDVKYILQIRHPVSRTISHIRHNYRNGAIGEHEFENADAIANLLSANPHVVEKSLCSKIYENWAVDLDKGNLLVMTLEEIATEPKATRQKLADFLKVDDSRFVMQPDNNQKKDEYKVDIPQKSVDYLRRYFEPEVSRCHEVFGELCANWD